MVRGIEGDRSGGACREATAAEASAQRPSPGARNTHLVGWVLAAAAALATAAPAVHGHQPQAQLPPGDDIRPVAEAAGAQGGPIEACTGAAIAPDRVITGSFGTDLEGSYVMVPFDVPQGTTAVRVKYCHDQPLLAEVPGTDTVNKHTLDMGVYEARPDPGQLWGTDELRGWGGSSRRDVTISGRGSIDPDPNPVAGTETTVGYEPGPIPAGEWAVELGVAAIGIELPALEDGRVNWRIEIELIDDPAYQEEPYEPVAYDTSPAAEGPGWYAGDLHVHARHSAPGDATMRETFDYAFCPDPDLGERCDASGARPGAGLDFITLTDYVNDRAWGEIGAFQVDYPGKLIARGAEVITYRGHINNQTSATLVDYRTGPIHEAAVSGPDLAGTAGPIDARDPARPARPAREVFDDVHAAGGWTQINHPRTFPSEVPLFGNLCRGCSWDYSDAETDYSKVDAIEVATGPAGLQFEPYPGPNPFTLLSVLYYERSLDSGGRNANRIAAVAVSDSHNAGRSNDPLTQSPIGQGTTVVHADELSERGIRAGIRARRTYAKIWGNDGPDLRLVAAEPGTGDGGRAMIGDEVAAERLRFRARVLNLERARAVRPGLYLLHVIRDGLPYRTVPIPEGDSFTLGFTSSKPGRYRLQVDRTLTGALSIEAVSSPIWHLPPQG